MPSLVMICPVVFVFGVRKECARDDGVRELGEVTYLEHPRRASKAAGL